MASEAPNETRDKYCNRTKIDDEGIITATSESQKATEFEVEKIYRCYDNLNGLEMPPGFPVLRRDRHIKYALNSLKTLPGSFAKLDASQMWMCYWSIHSLALLGVRLDESMQESLVKKVQRSYDKQNGGYGGGEYQLGHLAPTYAAINSLVITGEPSAWSTVDVESVRAFLYKSKSSDGSFVIHDGGETDIRAVYCAVSVAAILNILTPDLFDRTAEWIVRCQSYEGGFGGDPGQEAHGGYSFCAVAALYLLKSLHLCDLKALLRWAVNKQMKYEGGFQGRTNKLVDGCYSFWQGATVVIAQMGLAGSGELNMEANSIDWLFDQRMLQEYIILCCQHPYGGLMDKPKVQKDSYHTCYGLSGLSLCQTSKDAIVGDSRTNELTQIHPAFNLPVDKLSEAMKYFRNR